MTQSVVAPVKSPPSRGWYVAAVIAAVVAWGGGAVVLAQRITNSTESMMRVLAPGETELKLEAPGTYTIFQEPRSTFGGRLYNAAISDNLEVSVRSAATGERMPKHAGPSITYRTPTRQGVSLVQFDASTRGTYRIAARYRDGRNEPRMVLAIGRDFGADFLVTLGIAMVAGFGGLGVAIAMCVVVARRRRRALAASA